MEQGGQIRLRKVISGGQTGVDTAALRVSLARGLECGGWCPPGRANEAGVIPEEFPLHETPEERSAHAMDVARSLRTEWNVRDSDGTLILVDGGMDEGDAGTAWTRRAAVLHGKPVLIISVGEEGAAERIVGWIRKEEIAVLNVAGASEGSCPGIDARARRVLTWVLDRLEGA